MIIWIYILKEIRKIILINDLSKIQKQINISRCASEQPFYSYFNNKNKNSLTQGRLAQKVSLLLN
jgi:hypothetical protein